ncbi:radical SAM protein [Clostridium subterminale]|uniref:Radical SAM protein n=1 Tax=Clostridium subterminale TaxID=1550 RepID=A0ABN1KJT9_CLOSU
MKNEISKVIPGSIAEEVDIEVGDRLLRINENYVKDIIDYKFLITDEVLLLEVEKKDGEIWEIEIEKDYDEDLGIVFREGIIDKPMTCHNDCVFCFIDQLPKGMRETLYFKDDDSRLSFLQGNFLTLTNMKEEDIERIIKYKISPINVSVHTTNPELRVRMLNNRFAGKIYDILKRLAAAGIKMNTQIVCCPGINDGEELVSTIEDLYSLYPNVNSVAVVPLGITKHREGLRKLNLFTQETSLEQINLVKVLQEKYYKESGTPFVRLSDEFYIVSGESLPDSEHYQGFDQIEDGVGMVTLLKDTIDTTLSDLKKDGVGSFTFVTGALVYPEIVHIKDKIQRLNNKININVEKIPNKFFGETITVTGLLTGIDIINTLKEREVGDYIIIPDNVLRKGYELSNSDEAILLDDYTVEDLSRELNRKVIICDFTGDDLITIINEHLRED